MTETEIIDKIEQLREARPASDLNVINEKLEELQDAIQLALEKIKEKTNE